MGKEASRRVNIPRSTYNPYRRTDTTNQFSRNNICGSVKEGEVEEEELEEGEIVDESSASPPSSSNGFWDIDNRSSSSSNTSHSPSEGLCHGLPKSSSFQNQLSPLSGETSLDYYIRTASLKYKAQWPISWHSGTVHSSRTIHYTCAATVPGQRTCTQRSTIPGDIVNYIPMGSSDDVSASGPGAGKLTIHFMVLLPAYYKDATFRSNTDYHAALVITTNPVGFSTPLCPQARRANFKADRIPSFQSVMFDAHSPDRSLIPDEEIAWQWKWKANTRVGYHIKTVHQDSLHAVIIPDRPTGGLKLSDASYQQLLSKLTDILSMCIIYMLYQRRSPQS
ncbi:MAG: hypothetical protein Q9178_000778 [Gyalolechia marmorata]